MNEETQAEPERLETRTTAREQAQPESTHRRG